MKYLLYSIIIDFIFIIYITNFYINDKYYFIYLLNYCLITNYIKMIFNNKNKKPKYKWENIDFAENNKQKISDKIKEAIDT